MTLEEALGVLRGTKADWRYDHELGVHIPCCSVVTTKIMYHTTHEGRVTVEYLQACGNGPLPYDRVESGDCGEHHKR